MLYKSVLFMAALTAEIPLIVARETSVVDHSKHLKSRRGDPRLATRDGPQHLLWPAVGPSIGEVQDWQTELPPAAAVVLFAIAKCNHQWIEDLFFAVPKPGQEKEFRSDKVSLSLYDTKYRRVESNCQVTGDPNRAGWPNHFMTALNTTVHPTDQWGILGGTPPDSLDIKDYMRIFTGLPVDRYTGDEYASHTGALRFAIERSSESPIVFQTTASASTLAKSKYYVLMNPNLGMSGNPQVWTMGGAKTDFIRTDISVAALQADIGQIVFTTDFKRWTNSDWPPCAMVNGQFTCRAPPA